MKNKKFKLIPERQCGDCQACCEGWLHGNVHGELMYPGKPCHFIEDKGCSIYNDRPENPCKSYKCLWLEDASVPGHFKPNLIGTILTRKKIEDIEFIEASEAGKKIDATLLTWLFFSDKNFLYTINYNAYWWGSDQFNQTMKEFIKNGHNNLGAVSTALD